MIDNVSFGESALRIVWNVRVSRRLTSQDDCGICVCSSSAVG